MAAISLTMNVCHDWALRSWILSWGPFARVVSPPRLASAIRADLQAAGAQYHVMTHTRCRGSPSSAIALILFLAAPSFVRLYTDWLWFGEIGYQPVLATMLSSQGTLFTIVFAGMFVWLALNFRMAVRSLRPIRARCTPRRKGFNISLPGRRQFGTIANAVAGLVALLAGLYAAGEWNVVAGVASRCRLRSGGPAARPRRRRSTSSRCPSSNSSARCCSWASSWPPSRRGALYFLSGSLVSTFPARLSLSATATPSSGAAGRRISAGARLRRLAAAGRIPDSAAPGPAGASYTDVHARMPAALLLMAVSVVGAGLALLQAFTPRRWPIPAAVALYLVVSIGGGIYARCCSGSSSAPTSRSAKRRSSSTTSRPRGGRSRSIGVEERADLRRGAAVARGHRPQYRRRFRTSACGITSRCSTPSRSCRRSAPTTTSPRSTTTGT